VLVMGAIVPRGTDSHGAASTGRTRRVVVG
jgi:hypothetical protein